MSKIMLNGVEYAGTNANAKNTGFTAGNSGLSNNVQDAIGTNDISSVGESLTGAISNLNSTLALKQNPKNDSSDRVIVDINKTEYIWSYGRYYTTPCAGYFFVTNNGKAIAKTGKINGSTFLLAGDTTSTRNEISSVFVPKNQKLSVDVVDDGSAFFAYWV